MGSIYQVNGSRDRFTASITRDIRKEMIGKIDHLRAEQKRIEKELSESFDIGEFRRLNIINHHIEVATSRLRGEWLNGNFPAIPELSKSR